MRKPDLVLPFENPNGEYWRCKGVGGCGKVKPKSEFYAQPRNKSGVMDTCIKCQRARRKAKQAANAARVAELRERLGLPAPKPRGGYVRKAGWDPRGQQAKPTLGHEELTARSQVQNKSADDEQVAPSFIDLLSSFGRSTNK